MKMNTMPLESASARVVSGLLLSVVFLATSPLLAASGDTELRYDKGFVHRSSDGEHALKIDGWMQALHTTIVDDGLQESEFRVRRGRLGARGLISRWLSFRLLTELASSQVLLDYYLDASLAPWAKLRVGQFKVSFARQAFMPASKKEFVDDTITINAHRLGRDMGMMLHGATGGGTFEYQLAVLNGSGRNARQDNTHFMWVARLVAHPVGAVPLSEAELSGCADPRFAIGASTAYNSTTTASDGLDSTDVSMDVSTDRLAAAGEAAFVWRGLHLAVEGLWRRDDVNGSGPRDGVGAYAQSSYMLLPPHFQLGGRVAVHRPDTDASDADRFEGGAVANYYFDGHRLKLQLDYTTLASEVPGAEMELLHRVRLQLHAMF